MAGLDPAISGPQGIAGSSPAMTVLMFHSNLNTL